ncbi:MAG: response regulator transcription factor [Thermomicrobiales bacterium]|nr:response regulator transcription factor [Thermomicrobiales bacterium]MCO5228655.1 response regulator transcription factor [Thermomicrobiales bacterium]
MTIQVMLIDDHPIVRAGIAGMLAQTDGIEVIGEASNGQEAMPLIRSLSPDVILLDLRMPVIDGTELITRLRSDGNQVGILVLTTYDSDADILRAIEAGANGYLLKDTSHDDLIRAIEATSVGDSWLTPSVAAQLMRSVRQPEGEQLSSRETDVLRLVAKGNSNKEIAAALHVSQATVKTHLIHIFRKLDVNDRTAAVTLAMERGII